MEGMRRFGPVYLRPYLLARDAGYDDNIRFDARRARGDETVTIAPGLRALLRAGDRGGLFVSEELGYVAFRENTDLNHWNGSTRARGVLLLGRVALSLEERLDSFLERPNTEVDQRIRRLGNTVTAGARTLSAGRFSTGLFGKSERIDYVSRDSDTDEISSRLNRREKTLSAIGEARVRPKTTLTLESSLGFVDFDDPSQDRDSLVWSLLPGLRFDPSASLQGEMKAGVTRLNALQRKRGGYSGAVGDGHLSSRLGPFGRAKLGFGRALAFSTERDNLFYIGTTWTAAYEHFFSRRTSLEGSYGRGLNHYPEPDAPGAARPSGAGRDDHNITFQGTFRYRLNPRLALTLFIQRFIRDSSLDALDRDRNFYGFGSTYDL